MLVRLLHLARLLMRSLRTDSFQACLLRTMHARSGLLAGPVQTPSLHVLTKQLFKQASISSALKAHFIDCRLYSFSD